METTFDATSQLASSDPGDPATSTSTSVLERTETREEPSDGDRDRFAHFVRRDRVDRSIISGQPVVALCGKIWVPLRDPGKYPVCPKCLAIKDEMGKLGPNWPYSSGGDDA
ncbi:hypothetical protein HMPREF0044_0649 [Gleimia coleocanis DSM 15436]|uniref:DUF3039 domain-containing protein n=1 Tax=Gleimia coleocanis DSM 15436 TaxID=525245 RepID=C0W0Q6_9ACTO|nr:DUF3039 domain-containing protein [Gleimia coleocanis]EEH63630.1 hypothetical protein HMPREF0044_0649 [Gleimia coleocanis DSM 15436]